MSRILVVFGATGQQGGSVAHYVLNDPKLSKQYKVRAVTRDTTSPAARALQEQGAEVVKADVNNDASVHAAFRGAHTTFFLGAPEFGQDAFNHEKNQGIRVADIAVAEGVEYFIFSTLPHVSRMSNGKYTLVAGFDAKAEVEEYIRKLPIRSAFFAPGSFMENWTGIMKPYPVGDGTYVVKRHVSPQAQLPLICTSKDTGKYVGTILVEPEKYQGKTFCSATRLYSFAEICGIISKATGKTVKYEQISEEEHLRMLPRWGGYLVQMMSYQEEYGYYGEKTKELVEWAGENARGKLTTFEEYLEQAHLKLD